MMCFENHCDDPSKKKKNRKNGRKRKFKARCSTTMFLGSNSVYCSIVKGSFWKGEHVPDFFLFQRDDSEAHNEASACSFLRKATKLCLCGCWLTWVDIQIYSLAWNCIHSEIPVAKFQMQLAIAQATHRYSISLIKQSICYWWGEAGISTYVQSLIETVFTQCIQY